MTRRVLLISPPWRLASWPCLAIGVLKAHLERSGIAADGLHLHLDVALEIGLNRYDRVAQGWELGEALYFALYAPNESDAIVDRVAAKLDATGAADLIHWAKTDALRQLERATFARLDLVDLSSYALIGLSVGALQLGGSVYLARELKRRAPHLRVVLGGTSVLGAPGANLLERVPYIDAVVDGEGELAVAALARLPDWSEGQLSTVPNLFYRDGLGRVTRTPTMTTRSLDGALRPDMDEFYETARKAGVSRSDLVLPIEASRGCAWEHQAGDGQLRGCTFCGLYRNSPDYREKGLATVMADLRAGVEHTQVLEVSFVDAYLPTSYSKQLLRELAEADLDVTLFCEMRCDLDEETVRLMNSAGVRRVQLGVESFHTRLLARMAKGTRMIDNVSSIKLCEEFGIPFQYNVITQFPGVKASHLREMAAFLPWLHGFTPPTVAEFYLDRGSRIFRQPSRFGIDPDTFDRERLPFLPEALTDAPVTQFVSFDSADTQEVMDAWRDVTGSITAWQARFNQVRALGVRQLLVYRHAGESLLIEDWRGEDVLMLELNGTLRRALLACDRLIHRDALLALLSDTSVDELDASLAELRTHRLILQEGAWLLGLPVRSRLPSGSPRGWSTRVS